MGCSQILTVGMQGRPGFSQIGGHGFQYIYIYILYNSRSVLHAGVLLNIHSFFFFKNAFKQIFSIFLKYCTY